MTTDHTPTATPTPLIDEINALRAVTLPIMDDTLRCPVREVGAQVIHAYKHTHPSMRNLHAAIEKYMGWYFPDDAMFGPTTMSARRAKALTQLAELIVIAKNQLENNEKQGQVDDDAGSLTRNFRDCLRLDVDEKGLKAFMLHVKETPYHGLPDTLFVMACDVLTTAWIRALLSTDEEGFKEKYGELESMTRDFVKRFMPFDTTVVGDWVRD